MTYDLRAAHPALKLGYVSAAMCALAAFGQLGTAGAFKSSPTLTEVSPMATVPAASQPAPAPEAEAPAPVVWRFSNVDPQAAEQLNASLPLTDAPLLPARPFVLTGDAANRKRAADCLTQAVYFEAASESEQGQRAVAQVVLNRVRHPMFPNSVCGVVYQGAGGATGCQFSFVCDGSLDKPRTAYAWSAAERVAKAALAGRVEPSVGEATHYHTRWVAPYWAPTVAKVAQIGAHIFYRWAGAQGLPAAFSARYAAVERVPALHVAPTEPAEVELASAPEAADPAAQMDAALTHRPVRGADGRVHLVLDAQGYAMSGAPAAPAARPAPARPAIVMPVALAIPAAPRPAVRLAAEAAAPAAAIAPAAAKATPAPALAKPASAAARPAATAALDGAPIAAHAAA